MKTNIRRSKIKGIRRHGFRARMATKAAAKCWRASAAVRRARQEQELLSRAARDRGPPPPGS